MKRTPIDFIPYELPKELEKFITGARLYDSSCSPDARVYFIDKDGGYFLKKGKHAALETEAAMTDYFHKKGLAPEVLFYRMCDGGVDWLLTSRLNGEDLTNEKYLSDPRRLADTMGALLRKLHETDFSDCLMEDRMGRYLAFAEKNYQKGVFDKELFGDKFSFATPKEAHRVLEEGKTSFRNEVLLHGDFCLPNIILDSWKLSGYIDLGGAGVGDRHVDLFWGAWTLWFNLGTDEYRDRFFDSYGRDLINEEKLRTVAAAEVFG